jgi:hypothetical protein
LTTKTKSPRRRREAAAGSEVRPTALGWECECEEARGRISDVLGVAGAAMPSQLIIPIPDLTLDGEAENA